MKKETKYVVLSAAIIFLLISYFDRWWITKVWIVLDSTVKEYFYSSYILFFAIIFLLLLLFDYTVDAFKGKLVEMFK